jgi:hypothetical protein
LAWACLSIEYDVLSLYAPVLDQDARPDLGVLLGKHKPTMICVGIAEYVHRTANP